MKDTLTVLETLGPMLTKIFKSDGSVSSYDNPANFKVKPVEINGWPDLIKLLTGLHKNPKRCLVRGKLTGTESSKPGTFVRTNANFSDQPLHWVMVDVDGFEPGFAMPTDPAAVEEYIEAVLPDFQGASYYWHMSSSAGQSPKLKCHIHFLLKNPCTSAQLKAWSKTVGKQVDGALYSRVQVHYTADPIYEEGRDDPVAVRAGFHPGERDFVDLVITAEARETGAGEGGGDMKLVDPSEKAGIIGLFHRTYSAEQVLLELLEGFEQVSERRYTWHGGGGTPEGVWVHDRGMHVGSSHNTWPINGIANLWDTVRILKFGELDLAEDDFDQLDIDSREIQAKPSHVAMLEWAGQLPEIKEANRAEQSAEVDRLCALVQAAADARELELEVAPEIQTTELLVTDRDRIQVAFTAKLREFGSSLTKPQITRLLKPGRRSMTSENSPKWSKRWVWVTDDNSFMHLDTKHLVTERSFNALYDRHMPVNENGVRARASDFVLNECEMAIAARRIYNPGKDEIFEMDGLIWANTYKVDSGPEMPKAFSPRDRRAISLVEAHATMLIPNNRERTLFLDYLAYCVQRPGSKIRWAPLLKGVEGDGKSAFISLMQHVLGYLNVRVLDSSTLESSDFTAWRVGQCFTGVEEMKLHGHNRYDVYNKLKTPLSNDFVEVHCKGKDPITVPNTTNYLLLTNFDDGMPINDNDRRIMMIRSPFLTKEALRSSIAEDYFDELFDFAIKQHAGALRKWLYERELSSEFNPDGTAPITDARAMAVDMSMRDDDDAIASLLEDGGFGIYPNLIALSCLNDALLNQYGIKLNTGRAKATLAAYGFQMCSKGQIKWGGKNYRFYYRGERPDHPAAMAGKYEAARQSKEIEDDFAD